MSLKFSTNVYVQAVLVAGVTSLGLCSSSLSKTWVIVAGFSALLLGVTVYLEYRTHKILELMQSEKGRTMTIEKYRAMWRRLVGLAVGENVMNYLISKELQKKVNAEIEKTIHKAVKDYFTDEVKQALEPMIKDGLDRRLKMIPDKLEELFMTKEFEDRLGNLILNGIAEVYKDSLIAHIGSDLYARCEANFEWTQKFHAFLAKSMRSLGLRVGRVKKEELMHEEIAGP